MRSVVRAFAIKRLAKQDCPASQAQLRKWKDKTKGEAAGTNARRLAKAYIGRED
jgi:hypothetical protein